MDQFAERLIGKNLQQLIHSEHDVGIVFQDGGITAWTEVKIDLSLGEKPLVVRELQWSEEWLRIVFNEGDIRIGRVPNWPNPECFIYGAADDPSIMIVDRGEE